jgi:uncharacterized protein YkwD
LTLLRGRIINSRQAASPVDGRDLRVGGSYGAQVGYASAVEGRAGLAAAFLAVCAALVFVGAADGGARAASAYLAPEGVCTGATDPNAAPALQRRAVACLVNWARAQDRRTPLLHSSSLQRAAGLKGQKVASCGQFSHTPCGSGVTDPVAAAGYRYASFGENLFVGVLGQVSARDVVKAWLESPGHRENILRPYFREVGAASVRAQGLVGSGPEVVWVATFGSRR